MNTKIRRKIVLIASILGVFTALLYAKVCHCEFIIFDDHEYILMNYHVQQGLTWDSLAWAFTSLSRSNWHPLTWISHMLDVSLFGFAPMCHHLVNVFFHALSTALLFVALFRMTGNLWRSAFVAALFGVHPLHVESVAWVAERKDVLSGFFFMLILLIYERYARRPGTRNYLALLFLFSLGLMAKPMLVTVPLILLLLDVWPLGRTKIIQPADGSAWNPIALRLLFFEKAPLLILALLSSIITLAAQRQIISSFEVLPLTVRISNALLSYVAYLAKMFWPSSLAVYYAYPAAVPIGKTLGAEALLLIISIVVLLQLRRRPFLFVGWFWYLIMLLPVIGLVQVGGQAMADRYTYLPLIGPFLMLLWLVPDRVSEWFRRTRGAAIIPLAILAVLSAVTFLQLDHWGNGVALFKHALQVTPENAEGYKGLGIALNMEGRNEEALPQLLTALRLRYNDAETHVALGYVYSELGLLNEAIVHFKEAQKITPGDVVVTSSLQYLLQKQAAEGYRYSQL